MSTQPSYRPIYATFWDDPEQQELSDRACRVLLALKGTLPPSGIGHIYESVLAQRCGCSVEDLAQALEELERPKRDGLRGWIMREHQVVWVVNGLRFEPTIKPSNENHKKFVVDSLTPFGGLSSPMAIVHAFREHYPEWFGNSGGSSPNGIGKGHGRKASAKPSAKPSTEGIGRSPTLPRTLPNQSHPAGGGGVESGSGAAAVDELARARYLTRCVVALNTGMQTNPAAAMTFMEISTSSQGGAVTWFEDGIDVTTAEAVIARVCATFRPTPADRQINGLRYFDGRVRERHKELVNSGDVARANASEPVHPALRRTPERLAFLRKNGYAV